MSHYDHLRPSYLVFVCAFILCIVALYVGPNGTGFIFLACALIGWGIVINARERERDEQFWKQLATGLADQLIDRQNEMRYYQQTSDIVMHEPIDGGRVYDGPVTVADIHEPLFTNGEEA
jgi:hypothetical protein